MTKLNQNTLQKGSLRYIIFREEGVWYGVGLEFNIVESADTPDEALFLLLEATRGYLKSAQKAKARINHILNQKTDPEYEDLWDSLEVKKSNKEEVPSNVFTFGSMSNRSLVHA